MENVHVRSGSIIDADGNYLPGHEIELYDCVVYPTGYSESDGIDFDGDTTNLTVLAPGGSHIKEGDTAIIRDQEYVVVHVPWDWSQARRAWNHRHKPRLEIHVQRTEG